MPKANKWIQGAVHPNKEGTFRRYAKQHGGMAHGIQVGLKSKNSTTRHRALFAKNVRAFKHKR